MTILKCHIDVRELSFYGLDEVLLCYCRLVIVSRLARMIINKDSCSIYSNPVHDLPEEQTTQESLE